MCNCFDDEYVLYITYVYVGTYIYQSLITSLITFGLIKQATLYNCVEPITEHSSQIVHYCF